MKEYLTFILSLVAVMVILWPIRPRGKHYSIESYKAPPVKLDLPSGCDAACKESYSKSASHLMQIEADAVHDGSK